MSDKIFLNARYAFRSDTLENWQNINPVLEKGEPAIVSDGMDGEWLKIGDGINTFNFLEWKKGPKGEQGDTGPQGEKGDVGADGKDGKDAVTDQTYSPTSENAQSSKAVSEALTEYTYTSEFEGQVVYAVSKNGYATNDQVENIFNALIEDVLVPTAPKNYEKIATITVSTDTDGKLPTSIIFSADTSGKVFGLTDFYIKGLIGATDGSSAKANISVNGKAVFGSYTFGSTLNATSLRSWYMQWINLGENNGALCLAPAGTVSATKLPTTSNINIQTLSGGLILPSFEGYVPISKVEIVLSAGTNKTWINGSTFELWGVRK